MKQKRTALNAVIQITGHTAGMSTEKQAQTDYIDWVNTERSPYSHAFKMAAFGRVGYPDTATLIRHGRFSYIFFIEFKDIGKDMEPIQKYIADEILGQAGAHVYCCHTLKEAQRAYKLELTRIRKAAK